MSTSPVVFDKTARMVIGTHEQTFAAAQKKRKQGSLPPFAAPRTNGCFSGSDRSRTQDTKPLGLF